MAVAFSLALASLSVLAGCPGSLEGDFPPPGNSTGSGGSSSGSGGMTGSGGSNMSGSGGSGSGGSGSGSGGSMAACDAPAMVFKPKCGTASCHDTFEPKVSGSDPWGTLLNKDSASSTCMGKFVNPAKPASGVLFQRLKDGNCGAQMPLLPPYLTSNEMDCVTSWVTSKLP